MERVALKNLEFYRIIDDLAGHCHSEATRVLIRNISPFNDISSIHERFGQVKEVMRLREEGAPLSLYDFHDISGLIEKVRPAGVALDTKDLLLLLPILRLTEEISGILHGRDLIYLRPLSEGLSGFSFIRTKIEMTIDNDGNIIDSASPTLSGLRNKKRSLEKRIRKRLEEIIADRRVAPFLQDNFISMRSGRWVIPVRMDSKGEVKGIVHDVSRSGDTAFIEPLEIIGLSNELENIIAEERVEELRILRGISDMIRAEAGEIERQFRILVMIDLINSIALFSEKIKARIPHINESGLLRLHDARHPLLLMSRRHDEVVPLNIEVKSERVVVITGPNAGGKTVAIKTIGLLTAMALSGIPIPADSSSSIPMVRNIYVDIGDEQSIVDNLSTFSGHIRHISNFLSRTGSEDMVIIDELGTGTDPSQGAPIGCAILEELRDRGALVFATTHLTEIVGFVYSSQGMMNASMEFDQSTLCPLYRLRIGEPGESHAFEIAARYGLPEDIIVKARAKLGKGGELYKLINDLKEKRDDYERLIKELEGRMERIREKERVLDEMIEHAERERKEILRKAYEEARLLAIETKRRLNRIIDEVRVKGHRLARKEIEEASREVEEKIRDLSGEPVMDMCSIKEGDMVFVKTIGEDLKVTKVLYERRAVRVRLRNMEVEVPLEELRPPGGTTLEGRGGISVEMEDRVERELNIIGSRIDEGLSRLDSFLNHAFLSGLREVRVIHGVGKGLLLRAVREYLKGHGLVEGFNPAERGQGGDGVTVVRIVPRV